VASDPLPGHVRRGAHPGDRGRPPRSPKARRYCRTWPPRCRTNSPCALELPTLSSRYVLLPRMFQKPPGTSPRRGRLGHVCRIQSRFRVRVRVRHQRDRCPIRRYRAFRVGPGHVSFRGPGRREGACGMHFTYV